MQKNYICVKKSLDMTSSFERARNSRTFTKRYADFLTLSNNF